MKTITVITVVMLWVMVINAWVSAPSNPATWVFSLVFPLSIVMLRIIIKEEEDK